MTFNNAGAMPMIAGAPHSFHIPVMGTGFTIDTPIRVGRFGISSTISLVDDTLIEQMRAYYCAQMGEPYEPIGRTEADSRARRITAYLNLISTILERQIQTVRQERFEPGTEITRYFDLLPESDRKDLYYRMLESTDESVRAPLQEALRKTVVPGSIDVNIMTKLDRENPVADAQSSVLYRDAMAALRGFAMSEVQSSIVFSAGMNNALYSYASEFDDFLPDHKGRLRKKIVLKVSDYRSAEIQSRFLAKKGLWVSEFRIESGLNCGGHAFATRGFLMGPILNEFQACREGLVAKNRELCEKAWVKRGLGVPRDEDFDTRLTVQGGVGEAEEHRFLLKYYDVDSVGWGTPFLLAPDVVGVDEDLMNRLAAACEDDVYLSDSSPLGIKFWNLRTSPSEEARRARVESGQPGAPCRKGHLAMNTEFSGKPICPASKSYQRQKLAALDEEELSPDRRDVLREWVIAKSCICHELSGAVLKATGIDNTVEPAVCPGPNIAYFSRITCLDEMVGHIYGRLSVLGHSNRPHMFIQELKIYVEKLQEEIDLQSAEISTCTSKYICEFRENLLAGVEYYKEITEQFLVDKKEKFLGDLASLEQRIRSLEPLSVSG